MDIIENSRYLGKIDVDPIFNFCLNVDEKDWDEFTFRQNNFEQHSTTKTLAGIFPKRDNFPEMKEIRFKHTDEILNLLQPAITLATQFYDKKFYVTTALLVVLHPDTTVGIHSDTHPYFGVTHRLHVCINGDYDKMDFLIRGMKVEMNRGDVIEINNRLPHEVIYTGKTPRLNAIIDLMPIDHIGKTILDI